MPNIGLIQKYRTTFGDIDVKYFGSISWLIPLISNILSQSACANLSDSIDSLIKVKRSAFKFVMVATKTR